MKTISRLRYFLYLSILIVGCTTGKNALEKGNYDASVSKAVDRLKNSPKNEEALQVLSVAYNLALKDHLRKIEDAKLSGDIFKWEDIIVDYQQLNRLSDEINSCPTCIAVVPNAPKFVAELEETKYKAAEVRFAEGIKSLNENNRLSAKKAYYDFERAQQLYPQFKDVKSKINEAYSAALLKVVIQPISIRSTYRLNSYDFQQQINEFINSYRRNKFVIFYSEQDAVKHNLAVDQVISLNFDDFVVGQTYVKEKVEKIKRDSVIVGQTRQNKPIYATVKASFSLFNKQIASSGSLRLTITDWQTQKIVKQRALTSTYVWEDFWASYNGDDRALTNQQLKMTTKREILPPSPDAMFIAFSRPIYAQLVDEVSYFYSQY